MKLPLIETPVAQDEKKADSLGENAERKFMHDLATPLAVAIGQLEVLIDQELGAEPLTDAQRLRIEKARKALDRIRDMLVARRQSLGAQSSSTKPKAS